VVIVLGFIIVGCGRNEAPTTVPVEVSPFVSIKLRDPGHSADLSGAKIVGEPTNPEIREVAEVIGRVISAWSGKVEYLRFTRRHDGLEVDFAVGQDLISMRKVQGKWLVYAKGSVY